MKISIITLFPEFFQGFTTSIIGRAVTNKKIELQLIQLREFATDKHKTTDDRPFGGGPGMVMMVEPIDAALSSLGVSKGKKNSLIVLTSARGTLFNQAVANNWSNLEELTIICGHYEGVDERVAQHLVDAEIRIGDFVLTGGEPASLVMIDAVTRLIPEVLGNSDSNQNESHSQPGKLSFPQYTRPADYKGWTVPEVLLSGDHAKIESWRNQASIEASLEQS